MNNARKAAEAGAARIVRQVDRETGKTLPERRNDVRRFKRELGLSGRQLTKLRKKIAREERAEALARAKAAPPEPETGLVRPEP